MEQVKRSEGRAAVAGAACRACDYTKEGGNAHGNYPVAPKLAFDVLDEIHQKTEIPLVFHGGRKNNYFGLNEAMVQGTYENVKHHINVFNMK